jgi:hypothetical protein
MEFGEGLYYWTVVVVRKADPPEIVGEWGEKRWFKYYEPTPTPTPTEEPTWTPMPTPAAARQPGQSPSGPPDWR